MRLHLLEIAAFGPFTDPVSIDFDEVTDAGLFLLAGPTGAGKTSVLDAVCFALYGEVPGERNSAKRLRSDRAAPDAVPRVRLEVTLAGRRFRFVRSPAWQRPKRRGAGTTPQQASVTVSERREGRWHPLSTRLDEAGHLVGHLLGMSCPQFCQVAMLPQGRFQAFLRARSEERQRLLQQLFRTTRFEDVEAWLRERRAERRRQESALREALAHVAARAEEVAGPGRAPAGESDPGGLTAAALDGRLTAWVQEETGIARTAAEGSGSLRRSAASAVEHAEQLAAEAIRRDALLRRHDLAAAELRALEAAEDEQRRRARRLDLARRAARLTPLLQAAERADRDLDHAAAGAERHRAALAGLPTGADADVAQVAENLRQARARLLAALPRESELAGLRSELASAEEALAVTREGIETGRVEEERAAADLEAARRRHDAAAQATTALAGTRARWEARREQVRGHEEVERLTPLMATAELRQQEARAQLVAAKETWLEVREARIEGMAAELAGRLAVGDSCPVCGSADHPHPAVAGPEAPDGEAERRARRLVDDAEATAAACDAQVHELRTTLAVASRTAGADLPDAARAEYDALTCRMAELTRLAGQVTAAQDSLAVAQARLDSARAAAADATAREAALRSASCSLRDRHDPLRRELQALAAEHGVDTVADAVAVTERRLALVEAARTALEAHQHAVARAAGAAAALAGEVARLGFADVATAVAAVLSEVQVEALEREVAEHRARVLAARGVLAEPAVVAAVEAGPPDVPGTRAGLDRARAALSEADAAHALAVSRAGRLVALESELSAAVAAWAPVHADLTLVAGLSALVDGRSADNRLQMRLSAYVLAARLGQVVAAANLRLAQMSDQRYSLVHTGQRGAGETRGGLSLVVRDDWSGETRDPATLSGGETFVVSLSLALGLADVTAQEAGGADLDTLFVDEGFGSLDAETLDDVMDTLDSLRDGGRVVGVVSHVPEMRDRIPTRLEVDKQRGGSTVRLVRAG